MRHALFVLLAAALMALFVGPALASVTTIDFEAVALRHANDAPYEYGTITEWAGENGVTAQVPKAGQKVYYGTEYFNGWTLSQVDYVEFTYKRVNGGNNPYTNIVITNGAGAFGVISSQGGYTISEVVDPVANTTEKRVRYYFAGDNGNQAYGFNFYEPAGTAVWTQGQHLTWSDISGWTLLGVGETRPVSATEGANPRAPLDDALVILWGDSLDNYLGNRDIYDVVVAGAIEPQAEQDYYRAGSVPEAATLTVWTILASLGLLLARRNRRTA